MLRPAVPAPGQGSGVAGGRIARACVCLLLAACVTSGWPGSAGALEDYDFEQRVFFEPDTYVKDHAIVQLAGEYHIFYIVGHEGGGWDQPGNEINFGHASSFDFIHWTVHPRVLSINPFEWKNRNLWAPHVVRDGDAFLMAYTGIDSSVTQQIGIAASDDLFDWTDFSVQEAAYRPDTTWALWQPGSWSNCRDPYVRQLPDQSWMMVTTAQTRTEYIGAELGALSLAFSPDGLTWTDAGDPLAINNSSRMLESPHIYSRGATHYMTFTESAVPGVQLTTSTDLLSGWDVTQTETIDELGFAAEIFDAGGQTWYSRVRGFHTEDDVLSRAAVIDTAFIDGTGQLTIGQTNNLWSEWSEIEGDAFSFQPTFLDRPLGRTGVASGVEGHYWINTAESNWGPLGNVCSGCPPFEQRSGRVRSNAFTLTGERIELLVGGADDPGAIYVALKRVADDIVLFSETGTGSDVMTLREWDLTGLEGTEVFFEMADLSLTGHLNVDSIRELGGMASVDPTGTGQPGPVPFRVRPNPARQPTVSFRLDDAARVGLKVFDVRGRVARVLVDAELAAGEHRWQWDGRLDDGRDAPAGVYFLRLEAGAHTHNARITRLR